MSSPGSSGDEGAHVRPSLVNWAANAPDLDHNAKGSESSRRHARQGLDESALVPGSQCRNVFLGTLPPACLLRLLLRAHHPGS